MKMSPVSWFFCLFFLYVYFRACLQLLIDGINGPSLSTYLQDGGLPVVQIQHIGKQLVDTLLYLHGKSVVHRDLNVS